VKGVEFNLRKNKYYLLLASGTNIRPFSVDYHDIKRESSDKAIMLGEVGRLEARTKFFLRFHGSLMIVAWIGASMR
jgi:hypothetical protein